MTAVDLEDHIRRIVEKCPPLSPAQRDTIATLLRPSGEGNVPERSMQRLLLHYDRDGELLFAGPASNDLLQMVQSKFVARTENEWHPVDADEQHLRMKDAVFGNAKSRRALEYLVAHEAWDMLTPVTKLDPDGAPVHPSDHPWGVNRWL